MQFGDVQRICWEFHDGKHRGSTEEQRNIVLRYYDKVKNVLAYPDFPPSVASEVWRRMKKDKENES